MTYTQAKEVMKGVGREGFEDLLDRCSEEGIKAGLELGISPERLEDSYSGKWDSDEDFAQDLVESCGDIPRNLPCYIHIDWEGTARDIMMDYSEENGHYFRS